MANDNRYTDGGRSCFNGRAQIFSRNEGLVVAGLDEPAAALQDG